MSSGSTSAAGKHSEPPLEAANDPSTDTEAFDPITDDIVREEPRPTTGSTSAVRVAPAYPAHSTDTGPTREVATGSTRTVPAGASVMSEEDWAAVTRAATGTDRNDPEVPERRRSPLDVIGIIWIALATPFILLALAVRFVASGLFLKFEYFRPGFPADEFGFSASDREHYGTYVIDYLHNLDSRRYLADVILPNGEPVFISDELSHMADVKGLISLLYLIAFIGVIGVIIFALILSRRNGPGIHLGVRLGSILTIVALAATAVLAFLGWDTFFRGFHRIFFADGTWEFYLDDSLIRLFPPQFWVDAGIAVGGIVVLLAIVLFCFSFAGHKQRRALRRAAKDSAKAS
ncbi:integral membrane protein (TIGR01906 family) [Brevibacterium sanguinis]|uniref:Integral membrane protein (TIGR01906 family) n=3 Tax=Brevibacteriaceae TaxID=85019 RepID=A0A366IG40_9MICO|nr:integral membrane protein (TIGR01906 family) [Brevibacterium sanguinis]RBP70306.1 integral membrane protein (TIGR01906 family) [Brevibacterium celere]